MNNYLERREEIELEKKTIKRNALIGSISAAVLIGMFLASGIEATGGGMWMLTPAFVLMMAWYFYLIACVPFGWSALNRIRPDVFLILPVLGWIIYFFLKAFFSALIGIVAAPIAIVKYFRLRSEAASLETLC